MIQLAAGLILGILLLAGRETALVGAAACVAGLVLAVLACSSRLFATIEGSLRKIASRLKPMESGAPPEAQPIPVRDVLVSLAFALLGMAALAGGFVVVASSFAGMPQAAVVAGAFAVAWSVGYAAVPVPAGLGVREWVLVGLLAGTTGSGPILAAAVLQRLAQIVAELVTAGWGYTLEARVRHVGENAR